VKILLGDFDAKVGREDIFNPTIRNESLGYYELKKHKPWFDEAY
jgi:hypothetical protein